MKELKEYVRSIENFPKEGIIFRDITTLLQDPEGLQLAINDMQEKIKNIDFDSLFK